MNAGEMRHKITLQIPTNTANGQGGFDTTWSDGATVWAAIWPTSAREVVEAMQNGLNVTHRIRIRYLSGLKSFWRVKFGTRYFNIMSVLNPDERNVVQDLICEEAV